MIIYKWKILNDKEKEIIMAYYPNIALSSYNYAYCVNGDISYEYVNKFGNILFLGNITYQNVLYHTEVSITLYGNMYFYKYRYNCGYVLKLVNTFLSFKTMREYFKCLDCYVYMLVMNMTDIKDINRFIYGFYLLLK